MTRSRVVHYNHTGVVAGAERVLLNLLPQLRDEGLHSIVLSPPGPLQVEAGRLGVEVRECYPLEARFTWNPIKLAKYIASFVASVRNLRLQFRCLQPDVVHANSVRAGLVASSATLAMNIPIVWHVHDTLPRHPLSVAVRAFAAMSRRTSQIAVSRSTARTFCGTMWKWRLLPKMEVLHNVFTGAPSGSTPQQRESLRMELGATGRFLVGCVGQICARKNQIAMVEIFAEVLKATPESLLLIVGSSLFPCNVPYEDRLKQRIQELGVSANVRLLGKRDDVPLLLETMDLLVLPSRREPFPMILLEAMSAGTPTVAFAVDGVPELLADRRTAWLIRSGDAPQMARTILWAKNHAEQRGRLASAARIELMKRDTPELYAKRLANILLKHACPGGTDAPGVITEPHAQQWGETA